MSKNTSTNYPVAPIDDRAIEPIEPPPSRITGRMIRAAAELDLQRGVIAGEEPKILQAERATASVYAAAHAEMTHLAEDVVAIQRRDRDPEAQRWVDWFTEQIMPQAGTDMARIARTGVYNIAETASRSIYQEPEEDTRGVWDRLFGPRVK